MRLVGVVAEVLYVVMIVGGEFQRVADVLQGHQRARVCALMHSVSCKFCNSCHFLHYFFLL
jgi:hypothetical protein